MHKNAGDFLVKLPIDKNAGQRERCTARAKTPVIITNVIKNCKKQAIFSENRLKRLIFRLSVLNYINFEDLTAKFYLK